MFSLRLRDTEGAARLSCSRAEEVLQASLGVEPLKTLSVGKAWKVCDSQSWQKVTAQNRKESWGRHGLLITLAGKMNRFWVLVPKGALVLTRRQHCVEFP